MMHAALSATEVLQQKFNFKNYKIRGGSGIFEGGGADLTEQYWNNRRQNPPQ